MQTRIQEACQELDLALKSFELSDGSETKIREQEKLKEIRAQLEEIKEKLEPFSN